MKKLFALASMMMVLSVSAQQQRMDRPASKKVYIYEDNYKDHQFFENQIQYSDFEKYNLTLGQKQKLKVAFESYNKEIKYAKHQGKRVYEKEQKALNKKIEKILTNKQLAQYKRDQKRLKEVAFYKQPIIKNHR